MNLLETLLGFSSVEEDPLTEMLAWFIRTSPTLRSALLDAFDGTVRQFGGALPRSELGLVHEPLVQTQLVAANPRGTSCRYDLVCDWHSPRIRLIVEVKVWAGLTWGESSAEDGGVATPSHQVARYLDVAAGSPEIRTHVIVLAPYLVDLDFPTPPPLGYGGQLTWQVVHDAMLRVIDANEFVDDRTMTTLTKNFVHLLELKRMAVPKLTFDVLTSVSRYRQFEKSARMMLTHARDMLVAPGGTLAGFYKGNASAWQDDAHDRLGWRVWVEPTDINSFAFIGIHVGPDTIHEEVPDLYFFVQTRKGSEAQKKLDARGDELTQALEQFPKETTRAYRKPGGWEVYGIRRSLVEVARTLDPADATASFFRECVESGPGATLLAAYLAEVKGAAK